MSAYGKCSCSRHSIIFAPSTIPGRVDAAGPVIGRAEGPEHEDARLDCVKHEAAHAIAALTFCGSFYYATIGESGFHVSLTPASRRPRRPKLAEEMVIDAAGHAAERGAGSRRAPGICEFGQALLRDEDERGSCDICAIARRIDENFPTADFLVKLQTAVGALDLARRLFERPLWRDALDAMTEMLTERILVHGDEVAGVFDREALLRDFHEQINEYDVITHLPAFVAGWRSPRKTSRLGRDDHLDVEPDTASPPFTVSGSLSEMRHNRPETAP